MNILEVRDWDVWMEGNIGPEEFGENFPAHYFGTVHGTWLEACQKATAGCGYEVDVDRLGPGRHTIWALELFPNEHDARKANG